MKRWNKIERDLSLSAGRPASDTEMHKRFLRVNGLTEWAYFSHGGDDIVYILQHGRFPPAKRSRPVNGYPFPPYTDHARFYRGIGMPMLVYHPYMPPDEIRGEVEDWGREHSLSASVFDSAKSWYYPGNSALVVITAPGVEAVI